jgi:hypothetical protein
MTLQSSPYIWIGGSVSSGVSDNSVLSSRNDKLKACRTSELTHYPWRVVCYLQLECVNLSAQTVRRVQEDPWQTIMTPVRIQCVVVPHNLMVNTAALLVRVRATLLRSIATAVIRSAAETSSLPGSLFDKRGASGALLHFPTALAGGPHRLKSIPRARALLPDR